MGSWEGQGSRTKDGTVGSPAHRVQDQNSLAVPAVVGVPCSFSFKEIQGTQTWSPSPNTFLLIVTLPHTLPPASPALSQSREGREGVCLGVGRSVCSRRTDSLECNENRERLTPAQTRRKCRVLKGQKLHDKVKRLCSVKQGHFLKSGQI